MRALYLLLVSLPCWATSIQITPSVTNFGSYFLYEYSVSVSDQSAGETGYQFALSNLDGLVPNVLFISAPTGWSVNADFSNNIIQWVASSIGDDISSIPLGGFSFRSVFGPGTVPFQLDLEYPNLDVFEPSLAGFSSGPTRVPEPAPWTCLICGLTFLVLYKRS